jgi:hypothetical protein
MHGKLQKRIPLIINTLHPKTHETTGNKPAKKEMNNKHNMTIKPQHPYLQRKQAAGLPLKTINIFQDHTAAHIL